MFIIGIYKDCNLLKKKNKNKKHQIYMYALELNYQQNLTIQWRILRLDILLC